MTTDNTAIGNALDSLAVTIASLSGAKDITSIESSIASINTQVSSLQDSINRLPHPSTIATEDSINDLKLLLDKITEGVINKSPEDLNNINSIVSDIKSFLSNSFQPLGNYVTNDSLGSSVSNAGFAKSSDVSNTLNTAISNEVSRADNKYQLQGDYATHSDVSTALVPYDKSSDVDQKLTGFDPSPTVDKKIADAKQSMIDNLTNWAKNQEALLNTKEDIDAFNQAVASLKQYIAGAYLPLNGGGTVEGNVTVDGDGSYGNVTAGAKLTAKIKNHITNIFFQPQIINGVVIGSFGVQDDSGNWSVWQFRASDGRILDPTGAEIARISDIPALPDMTQYAKENDLVTLQGQVKALGNSSSGNFLPLSGGTVEGNVTFQGTSSIIFNYTTEDGGGISIGDSKNGGIGFSVASVSLEAIGFSIGSVFDSGIGYNIVRVEGGTGYNIQFVQEGGTGLSINVIDNQSLATNITGPMQANGGNIPTHLNYGNYAIPKIQELPNQTVTSGAVIQLKTAYNIIPTVYASPQTAGISFSISNKTNSSFVINFTGASSAVFDFLIIGA